MAEKRRIASTAGLSWEKSLEKHEIYGRVREEKCQDFSGHKIPWKTPHGIPPYYSSFSRQGLESEISEVYSHSFSALLPKYGNEKMRRLIGWLKMTDIINFTSLHTSIFEIVFWGYGGQSPLPQLHVSTYFNLWNRTMRLWGAKPTTTASRLCILEYLK